MIFKNLDGENTADIYNIESVVFPDSYSQSLLNQMVNNELYKYSMVLYEKNCIGYILATEILGEAEILRVAVNPLYIKKGYASEMIKQFIQNLIFDDVEKVHLEVRKSNIAAITLYEKFGFQCVGLRHEYYSDGEDALLYTLQLGGD